MVETRKKNDNLTATLGDLADVDRTVESLKMEVSFSNEQPDSTLFYSNNN